MLSSNPTYYLGPPKISTLEFSVFADDAALVAALRRGALDGALLGPDASQADLDVVRENATYDAHPLAGTAFNVIYLDSHLPSFGDPAVRAALRQAINLDALLDIAGPAPGVPTTNGVSRMSWAGTRSEPPAFDPGGAASALERAGWSRRNSDGVREKDGNTLSFTFATANDPQTVALADEIARQWRVIGVEADVRPGDSASFVTGTLLARTFEAALAVVSPGPESGPISLLA